MVLLSIVVPTHNRSVYALSCIEAVLKFPDADLQLVVTDTSSDRLLFNRLHDGSNRFFEDGRLKYVKIDELSDLTKNHNDALALAEGEYVCVIGDDDCITSAALDAARWASDRGVPVVSQTVTATYAWPDFRSRLARGGHAARLYVPRKAGSARWRQADHDLAAALQRAFQATDAMPRCYHGIVRRDLLEQVRARTGAYFHGSSPDMSGAVSLACLIDHYCEVDIPLTIPGVSGGSNSGRSAMNTHKGDLSSETQTSGFQEQGWTEGVPRFFSVETVWAHAGLSSLAMLRPELVPAFNYSRLLALCSLRHPEYGVAINAAAAEAKRLLPGGSTLSIDREKWFGRWENVKYLTKRALNPTVANGRHYFSQVRSVADASRIFEDYVKTKGISFGTPDEHRH